MRERHDFKFRRKDGSDLWAIVSADPIFDSAGAYAGSLGLITDVTDRKQAETALRSLVLGPFGSYRFVPGCGTVLIS